LPTFVSLVSLAILSLVICTTRIVDVDSLLLKFHLRLLVLAILPTRFTLRRLYHAILRVTSVICFSVICVIFIRYINWVVPIYIIITLIHTAVISCAVIFAAVISASLTSRCALLRDSSAILIRVYCFILIWLLLAILSRLVVTLASFSLRLLLTFRLGLVFISLLLRFSVLSSLGLRLSLSIYFVPFLLGTDVFKNAQESHIALKITLRVKADEHIYIEREHLGCARDQAHRFHRASLCVNAHGPASLCDPKTSDHVTFR